MRAFYCERLLATVLVAATMLMTSVAQASTVSGVNLTLRLEATGYSDLTIFDRDFDETVTFGFLDSRDNVFGLRPVAEFGFSVGSTYSLIASAGSASSGRTTDCTFGAVDCRGSFISMAGTAGQHTFWIGDGAGQTVFGDFALQGGTSVGDQVVLNTFEGVNYFDSFNPGGVDFVSAEWSSDTHVFTVVENNLAPIPLPASVLMLLAAIAGLGVFASVGRKPGLPAT